METVELVDRYIDHEKLYSTEGRKGLTNLCQLARALGYKDPNYYGQLTSNASLGDLINFLEDNSGAIEAVINWIRDQESEDWSQSLMDHVPAPDMEKEDEEWLTPKAE